MRKNLEEATRKRIDDQAAIVASLTPGSRQHEIATKILLLMRDSLHVLLEIDVLMRELDDSHGKAAE